MSQNLTHRRSFADQELGSERRQGHRYCEEKEGARWVGEQATRGGLEDCSTRDGLCEAGCKGFPRDRLKALVKQRGDTACFRSKVRFENGGKV